MIASGCGRAPHTGNWTTDTKRLTDALTNERLRLAADLGEQGRTEERDILVSPKMWHEQVRSPVSEWWARIRQKLTRPTPHPPEWQLATPDGVVDLRNGAIEAHDSAKHDSLAVTVGHFRPDDATQLKEMLYGERLHHNIDRSDYETLLQMLGLAVSRKAQDHRSILWLYGVSGGGKGQLKNLIARAFGRYTGFVTLEMLQGRKADIDANMTDILERDPIFVICDELGARVNESKLLALTGNSEYRARRPHQRYPIVLALRCLWIAPTVNPPTIRVHRGFKRRSAVIGFEHEFPLENRNEAFSQEQLDAMVTLAALEARPVYGPGYKAPEGNPSRRQRLLAEADQVQDWLESLPDSYHGWTMKALLDHYNNTEEGAITATRLGEAVSDSAVWHKARRYDGPMTLMRKPAALAGLE